MRLPGRCGRRCARPGSWLAPCGRPARLWHPAPPPPPRKPRATPPRHPHARFARNAVTAGSIASNIVLSPSCGLPRSTTPASPASSASASCSRCELLAVAGDTAEAKEERAIERAAGAADRADEGHPDKAEEVVQVFGLVGIHLRRGRRCPARQVGPVVAVTDRRIEFGEIAALLDQALIDETQPVQQLLVARRPPSRSPSDAPPQRRVSRPAHPRGPSISSSARSTVTEQPAMSSDVM